jgi:NAD(P)-dependent dehydrogenase (short-subunit alcohol dehydrogenase family)
LTAGGAGARQVVITGGTGALGSAVVRRMLADGARCHVTYVDAAELERFAERDRVALHRVDCGSESEVQAFYAALPALDASVHLVGGFAMAKLADTAVADFERMFQLNAVTAFLCCREAVKRMRPGAGRLVNVAARPVLEPTAGMVAYAVAKSAVAALTSALARELAAEGILVNAVVPSIMDTAANRKAMPNADFARWPKVEEVAEAIAFLASASNHLTSGALVPVYGKS